MTCLRSGPELMAWSRMCLKHPKALGSQSVRSAQPLRNIWGGGKKALTSARVILGPSRTIDDLDFHPLLRHNPLLHRPRGIHLIPLSRMQPHAPLRHALLTLPTPLADADRTLVDARLARRLPVALAASLPAERADRLPLVRAGGEGGRFGEDEVGEVRAALARLVGDAVARVLVLVVLLMTREGPCSQRP